MSNSTAESFPVGSTYVFYQQYFTWVYPGLCFSDCPNWQSTGKAVGCGGWMLGMLWMEMRVAKKTGDFVHPGFTWKQHHGTKQEDKKNSLIQCFVSVLMSAFLQSYSGTSWWNRYMAEFRYMHKSLLNKPFRIKH